MTATNQLAAQPPLLWHARRSCCSAPGGCAGGHPGLIRLPGPRPASAAVPAIYSSNISAAGLSAKGTPRRRRRRRQPRDWTQGSSAAPPQAAGGGSTSRLRPRTRASSTRSRWPLSWASARWCVHARTFPCSAGASPNAVPCARARRPGPRKEGPWPAQPPLRGPAVCRATHSHAVRRSCLCTHRSRTGQITQPASIAARRLVPRMHACTHGALCSASAQHRPVRPTRCATPPAEHPLAGYPRRCNCTQALTAFCRALDRRPARSLAPPRPCTRSASSVMAWCCWATPKRVLPPRYGSSLRRSRVSCVPLSDLLRFGRALPGMLVGTRRRAVPLQGLCNLAVCLPALHPRVRWAWRGDIQRARQRWACGPPCF